MKPAKKNAMKYYPDSFDDEEVLDCQVHLHRLKKKHGLQPAKAAFKASKPRSLQATKPRRWSAKSSQSIAPKRCDLSEFQQRLVASDLPQGAALSDPHSPLTKNQRTDTSKLVALFRYTSLNHGQVFKGLVAVSAILSVFLVIIALAIPEVDTKQSPLIMAKTLNNKTLDPDTLIVVAVNL